MLIDSKLTEIFYFTDEFCKDFSKSMTCHQLSERTGKKRRNKPCRMSDSEIITILIAFHLGNYRNLKHFYLFYVKVHLQTEFPKTVSYNRFVELQQKAMLPLVMFLKIMKLGECSGVSFVDSTPIRVCKNKRIFNHKVFEGLAKRGRSTMGWFFGFKLHIVVNEVGELLGFTITPGNVDDREPLKNGDFLDKVYGKLFADKGYIGQELFEMLFINGIQLMTSLRKKMKGSLMSLSDSIFLRKRSVIETINDVLKNTCQVEHSRHRSFGNFITNLVSGLIAYTFLPTKPRIKYETEPSYGQLALY